MSGWDQHHDADRETPSRPPLLLLLLTAAVIVAIALWAFQ